MMHQKHRRKSPTVEIENILRRLITSLVESGSWYFFLFKCGSDSVRYIHGSLNVLFFIGGL